MSREKLPYRKAVYAFLIDGQKIMAKDSKTFMTFPGGGVDPGESIEEAVRREILEETGAVLDKNLKLVAIDPSSGENCEYNFQPSIITASKVIS